MKKYWFAALMCILVGGTALSQEYYGDSIDFLNLPSGVYYDGWWPDSAWWDTTQSRWNIGAHVGGTNLVSRINARYNYTEQEELRVTGIAIVLGPLNSLYAEENPEYLLLYDATPDSLVVKARIPIHQNDSHLYAKTRSLYQLSNYGCRYGNGFNYVVMPYYKYYFDSAIFVSDSFYVGFSSSIGFLDTAPPYPHIECNIIWAEFQDAYMYLDSSYEEGLVPFQCPRVPLQRYIVIDSENNISYHKWRASAMIFALQDDPPAPAPPCPRVNVVRAAMQEDGVCLIWSWGTDSLHVGWEVAWGRAGTPPDSCETVACSSPQTVLEGVDRGVRYVAYVRGLCRHRGNVYYSEWSDSVAVYIPNRYTVVAEANYAERGSVEGGGEYEEGETAVLTARAWRPYNFLRWDDGDSVNPRRVVVTQDTAFTALFASEEGIATADSLERTVTLLPNPAKERVKVLCAYGLKGVEVLDAQGRTVMSQSVEGHAAELDISRWAAGSYVVKIYTERGIVSKRLVVE